MEEKHNVRCVVCGRKLKSHESKRVGMGKICQERYRKKMHVKGLIALNEKKRGEK